MRHIRLWWEMLRTSLWFVPGLFVVATVALAQILIEIDHHLDLKALQSDWPRLFAVSAAGARGMLATIASSMINLAGVAFSITIVALTLASSQYTSRILRNFMRDRANQMVLGAFVSIFVYCLVVLRTIRGTQGEEFVPATSILFAVALAFVGIGCLIFFIHHIATSIQAESIVRAAADETVNTIDVRFPEKTHRPEQDESASPSQFPVESMTWRPIQATASGYLQSVDEQTLIEFATAQQLVVRLERDVGAFVVRGCPLLSISAESMPNQEAIEVLDGACRIGRQRTMVQDAGYGIRQIVDVALKALSPGINDTTTAVTCVHHLCMILVHLTERQVPSRYRVHDGQVRLITAGPTVPSLLAESFDQIRQNATGNVAVMRSLIEALGVIASRTREAEFRDALTQHLAMIVELAHRTISAPADREEIETAQLHVTQLLHR